MSTAKVAPYWKYPTNPGVFGDDTATAGTSGPRVWRRLHGGIANAPAYQLWLSAVGLQPENNRFFGTTYPWLGFRIGVIGEV